MRTRTDARPAPAVFPGDTPQPYFSPDELSIRRVLSRSFKPYV